MTVNGKQTDSHTPESCHSVSGKRLLPDRCTHAEKVVRKRQQSTSAIGAYGLLFDIPAEEVSRCKVEKRTAKSTAENCFADPFFRECGPFYRVVRTNGSRVAHKKNVFSAMPTASLRKETGIFAEKQLKPANKCNKTCRKTFWLARIAECVCQQKQTKCCLLLQKAKK